MYESYLRDLVELQCGHGDEAVENSRRLESLMTGEILQCGHGDEAVENSRRSGLSSVNSMDFNAATAMRPWRTAADRPARLAAAYFNAATAMRPWRTPAWAARKSAPRNFNAATAMRPWRTGSSHRSQHAEIVLQCGHGDEAVENNIEGFYRLNNNLLQCGHGDEAVENVAPATPADCAADFNAATAMRPWRTAFAKLIFPDAR